MSERLNSLRDTLIAFLHFDQVAVAKISLRLDDREFVRDLVEVCKPFDDYTNDPRMAAYYLFLAPIAALELVAIAWRSCCACRSTVRRWTPASRVT